MTKLKPSERRVPFNRLVHPKTVKLIKRLAKSKKISEGKLIDRAVETLAVTETFGREHLKPSKPVRM